MPVFSTVRCKTRHYYTLEISFGSQSNSLNMYDQNNELPHTYKRTYMFKYFKPFHLVYSLY